MFAFSFAGIWTFPFSLLFLWLIILSPIARAQQQNQDTGNHQNIAPRELLLNASTAYGAVSSCEFTLNHRMGYAPEWLTYMESIGEPFDADGKRVRGKYEFFSEDDKFGWKVLSFRDDGNVVFDKSGAWDGTNWQALDRGQSVGTVLELLPRRSGLEESIGFLGSPLETAFLFLLPIPRDTRISQREMVEKLSDSRVTLDKLADRRLWERMLKLATTFEVRTDPNDKGRHFIFLEFGGNYFRGNRAKEVRYRVWFDVEHPTFPYRVESFDVETGHQANVFEVTGPFQQVEGIDVPESYRTSSYHVQSDYRGPTRFADFTKVRAKFGHDIKDERFEFDASMAARVRHLDAKP